MESFLFSYVTNITINPLKHHTVPVPVGKNHNTINNDTMTCCDVIMPIITFYQNVDRKCPSLGGRNDTGTSPAGPAEIKRLY